MNPYTMVSNFELSSWVCWFRSFKLVPGDQQFESAHVPIVSISANKVLPT